MKKSRFLSEKKSVFLILSLQWLSCQTMIYAQKLNQKSETWKEKQHFGQSDSEYNKTKQKETIERESEAKEPWIRTRKCFCPDRRRGFCLTKSSPLFLSFCLFLSLFVCFSVTERVKERGALSQIHESRFLSSRVNSGKHKALACASVRLCVRLSASASSNPPWNFWRICLCI